MASDRKKAKRALRAKAKARRAKIVRHEVDDDCAEILDICAENMLDLFCKLAIAEEAGMFEMLKTLIVDTGRAEMAYPDDEVDWQIVILMMYGRLIEGRPQDWMEQRDFKDAYAQAARWVGRSELIEAWEDAHDFEQ